MRETVLTVTGLYAGYGEKPMVSDVSFFLGKGEIFRSEERRVGKEC